MRTSDFDYLMAPELIAQSPAEPRCNSRLMVLDRGSGAITHRRFFEIADYLCPGDVLVFNDTRVIPARLSGRKVGTGGRVEMLLLRRLGVGTWETLVRPGKRVRIGARIEIANGRGTAVVAEVTALGKDGIRELTFSDERPLAGLGKVPLPPYIHLPLADPERYQTVYSRVNGSVAAPTAGLHFTPEMLGSIEQKGVRCLFVTLHIGLDTFRPVDVDNPAEHPIHREYGVLSREVAGELSQAKAEGRRVICVGTTTVRLLEQAARANGSLQPFEGWASLFILPGYRFGVADALVTNFHLPRSTLLMLVSAFAGKGLIDRAYQEAIASGYRFYSFGDAMLII
ncbi:MAG: tRNA preQ1(34) S-adenosylmethionine ribosyltransferase-isomerase QueA [Chloroflexi bacterium]|nr:tRNA preQ1(34) S-adenosylmethionine ribosyltransferase-isomerase QueA [Chloroflexota bacterium]